MNLPTKRADIWRKATHQEVIVALSRLSALPSRQVEHGNAELAKDLMYRALSGVTAYAIDEAVTAVSQNKLGHPFFPEPSELRMLCDRAMEPHIEEARRIRQREQQARENAEIDAVYARRTPESIARVRALYERFCADYEASNPGHEPFIPTLDPELVAKIADAPTTFTKPFRQASGQ